MTTTTLSSNSSQFRPLYLTTLRRNAGYFGLISVLIFLFYPLQFALEIFKKLPDEYLTPAALKEVESNAYYLYNLNGAGNNMTDVSIVFFTAIMVLLPFVLALILNSYMHSKKSTDVYHSLPIRRETLLYANAAVAMTIITVPAVISDLAIAAMSIAKFGMHPEILAQQFLSLFGWLSCALAIYAGTTLVSVLSGTVFDTMVFSAVLLHVVVILKGIFLMLCSLFLSGFIPSEQTVTNLLLQTPTLTMIHRLSFVQANPTTTERMQQLFSNNLAIVIYLVLGVLVLLLAGRLYRMRHSEIAESTGLSGPLPNFIKLVGTIVCAVLSGLLFYSINNESSKGIYLFWLVVGGMVGFAILDVILNRGFKGILKRLLVGGGMVAATALGSILVLYGGLGYEARVPAADNIDSVVVSGYSGYSGNQIFIAKNIQHSGRNSYSYSTTTNEVTLREPQTVQTLLAFHQDIVERGIRHGQFTDLSEEVTSVRRTISLEYRMKSGATIRRSYSIMSPESLGKLLELETQPEFITQSNGLFAAKPEQIESWVLQDAFGSVRLSLPLSPADSGALLEAIRADLLARTPESLQSPSSPPLGALVMRSKSNLPGRDPLLEGEATVQRASFYLYAEDEQTVRFLRSRNLLEQVATDLSDCYAVTLSVQQLDSYIYGGSRSGLVTQVTPEESTFYPAALAETEADIQRRKEMLEKSMLEPLEPYYEYKEDSYGAFVLKDSADIALLAQNARGQCRIDQTYLVANFFFEGGSSPGSSVLIPYSSLPASLQAKLPLKSSTPVS